MINLLAFFLLVFGSYQPVHANDQPCADINGDGQVDVSDFLILTNQFGQATQCAAPSKPPIVVVREKGNLYSDTLRVGRMTGHDRTMILVDVDLTKVRELIESGYSIIDFYVTKNEKSQISHTRPETYVIQTYHKDSVDMFFDVLGDGSDLLWDLGAEISRGETTFGPYFYTVNFVMLHNANIYTNNSTD